MSDEKRLAQQVVSLLDVDEHPPQEGQTVLALGIGGVLCSTVWRGDSSLFFKAWMPYPRVSKTIKDKLYASYAGGESFGNYGASVR